MLLGVFVHAATVGDFGRIESVSEISDLFRMSLFFMISGFLAAMLLGRQPIGKFWKGRLRNLIIPLVFGVVILNPPTLYMVYAYFNGRPDSLAEVWNAVFGDSTGVSGQLVWHLHLWFLVSLSVYALLAPAFLRPARRLIEILLALLPKGSALLPWFGVIFVVITTMTLLAALEAAERITGSLPWLMRVTALYSPYYFMGLALHSASGTGREMIRPGYLLSFFVVLLYIASEFVLLDGVAQEVIEVVSLAAMRTWICFVLIYWGQVWLEGRSRITDMFSRSIYTVYLLHYGVIYALALLSARFMGTDTAAFYVFLSITTIFVGLAVHAFIVSRSHVLTFLLNGRLTLVKA